MENTRHSNVTLDEDYNGWHPDPLGRFDERYIVYGEPSRLVRNQSIEQTDRQPLTFETPAVAADELVDSSPPAHIVEPADPVPAASSRLRVRRSRQRAIGVGVIVCLRARCHRVRVETARAPDHADIHDRSASPQPGPGEGAHVPSNAELTPTQSCAVPGNATSRTVRAHGADHGMGERTAQ